MFYISISRVDGRKLVSFFGTSSSNLPRNKLNIWGTKICREQCRPRDNGIMYKTCKGHLYQYINEKRNHLKSGVSVAWRQMKIFINNCYFCIVNSKVVNRNNSDKCSFPDLSSASRPVPNSDILPILGNVNYHSSQKISLAYVIPNTVKIAELIRVNFKQPHIMNVLNQKELNYLTRDLNLS